jgi:Fe-S cluster biogenesis protein NfuA
MSELTIANAVAYVLDSEIRPLLHFHGGDVRVAEISTDGSVHLEYVGACHGCNLQVVTHFVTVRERLLKVEGVTEVVTRGVRISDAAQRRITAASARKNP